ncbi:apolipoprotein C-II-like [Hyperolius riggenbachi]|uniref:apolipoprotein C-II-like n=1 Tax=Hyperolius riggenbachi TaxID=752182 RepID=UPI0035A3CBBD
MRLTQIAAVTLLVLLVSTGIESYRIQKREAEGYITKAQDAVVSAWETVSTAVTSTATGLYEKVDETGVPDKIKEAYEKTADTVGYYGNILYDQVYHWFN